MWHTEQNLKKKQSHLHCIFSYSEGLNLQHSQPMIWKN